MRKLLFTAGLFVLAFMVQAHMVTPVKWNVEINPLKGGNQYEIVAKAKIDKGFKLYGVNLGEGGPVKTSFNFETTENCKKFGKAEEATPAKKSHDKMFDMEVEYYKETAEIRHKIWVTGKPAKVSGYITWMSCNDEMCTPPTDEDFEFIIK